MTGKNQPADDPKPDPAETDDDQDEPLGMDDKVSLYGVDPAEALRAFLRTPRHRAKKR